MQVIEAHGARIPQIGLGTMTLKDDVCVQAVKTALQIGYRHLDTAAFYANEKGNGEGLRQSGVKREDVFICTKVRQGDLMPDAFAKVLEQSLANLKLPYVDLLLFHWNNPDIPLKLSVGALCKAKKEGKTKHIGSPRAKSTAWRSLPIAQSRAARSPAQTCSNASERRTAKARPRSRFAISHRWAFAQFRARPILST